MSRDTLDDSPLSATTSATNAGSTDGSSAGSTDASARQHSTLLAAAALAVLAFVPSLIAAPGRMPADSKLYLYLDPGRLMADAAGSFDPRQFAGWVPHQHVAYLWPSGPWFWVFDQAGAPDWIAHRLWIGSIMLAAGLGVRWCARQLQLAPLAAFMAAVVYQVSPYVLPYVSRTSVMLLPWAGLGWMVGLTIRSCHRRGWRDPALMALVVLTVGAVNATALAMIVPGPVLWLIHAVWSRLTPWRVAVGVALRTVALSIGVSLWWLVGLVLQGRYGADVLRYSESLADVSHTSTSAEVWRGLGYWLFYIRDPFTATTTESLRYLISTPAILVSFAVPVVGLAGLAWTRWIHRRFAVLLVATGAILAVGVHPSDDRPPLVALLTGDGDAGLALALRSSTRALPVMNLGLALAVGALVGAACSLRRRWRVGVRPDVVIAVGVGVLVAVNMPGLWTGAFVDPALERDQDPPAEWLAAAADLDESDPDRVLMLPGAEFGAYRWGYTVDQPLAGLTEADVVTRDLLPLGSAPAMDLWYALDDRFQDGVAESTTIADVARLFAADTVWLTNDLADDRFATARPEVVRDVVLDSSATGEVTPYGEPVENVRVFGPVDGRAIADPRVGKPTPTVELVELATDDPSTSLARTYEHTMVVVGSGDGVVDAAAGGLLSPSVAIRYSADDPDLAPTDVAVVVTDSNRDRDRHWRSSQDTTGFTESGGPAADLVGSEPPDTRLPVFASDDGATQTVAIQRGPVTATASAYGEPFAYTPEHRAAMAVDGDLTTSWSVGEHGDPVGASIELGFPAGSAASTLTVHQAGRTGEREIIQIEVTEGDASGWRSDTKRLVELSRDRAGVTGQQIALGGATTAVRIEIVDVAGGDPFTPGAVAGVGFTELDLGLEPTEEIVRPPEPPVDIPADLPYAVVLTRLRVDPMDRWRSDPEPTMIRELTLDSPGVFSPTYTVRVDGRATDEQLAAVFDWPVVASARLTGSLRSVGAAAFDGDTDTAWTTPFGGAVGSSVRIEGATEPISAIRIDQQLADSSSVREIELRSGGEFRLVTLAPDDAGSATATVEPPLPAGTIELIVTAVEPTTTVDRRFGDVVELPAVISEIAFDGAPRIDPLDSRSLTTGCERLGTIDGDDISAALTISGAGWLDGGPLRAHPCEPGVRLDAGTHLLRGDGGVFDLDRIVLDDGVSARLLEVADRPATVELAHDRFGGSYELPGCPTGCWFTFGEGYNEAWSASADGVDLGSPALIDGGFNGWWIEPSDESVVVAVRWSAQTPLTAGLIASAVAALGCVALIVGRRSRAGLADSSPIDAPTFVVRRPRLSRQPALVAWVSWAVIGFLLVGAVGFVLGAVAGAVMWWTRRRDLPILVTIATVTVIGVYVAIEERRLAPLPNGGWPISFDDVHELGVFAAATLFVAALVADDDAPPEPHGDGSAPLPSDP